MKLLVQKAIDVETVVKKKRSLLVLYSIIYTLNAKDKHQFYDKLLI
ncbi:hypothetical protein CBB_A0057 [Clostridium botulinum Bf]|nr:hypothetical protein CBB_A0098 [Clostridium botulinum Bf]EDT83702.1 hypothetical protein CBB_A0073 [Clostridium botulinum Bf]EDT83710.1 hypothetical protein CBB_A0057 [Clostridium botulinum Bf]